jgi:phosphoribosylaminoimidazole-succinocarboxamide synthase
MKFEAPEENFKQGIRSVDLSGIGTPLSSGKVRDRSLVDIKHGKAIILVTTDRLSTYDSVVGSIPGKGQVLNLSTEYWFNRVEDLVVNHTIKVPHPNITIARYIPDEQRLPVEIVMRRFMAKSSTATSIYHNYAALGRRNIYGIDFPDGLVANQEFPMGTIVTPTTKAKEGEHDEELTVEEAKDRVDNLLGKGVWQKAKTAALGLYDRAYGQSLQRGLIAVDTKVEMGVDEDGKLVIIDELFTPDSSRWWLLKSYGECMAKGKDPEGFDKEVARKYQSDHGFTGKEGQEIAVMPDDIINHTSVVYKDAYNRITGQTLPKATSNPEIIRQEILNSLNNLAS